MKLFGIHSWNVRTQGKAHVYEALWMETMRYIKIFVSESDEAVSVSVSNFRFAYAESAYAETELIQRKLAGENSMSAAPAIDRLFSYFGAIFPDAYAQAGGGCNCPPFDQPCQLGCYSNALGSLGPAINNMAGATNNAAGAVNGLNQTGQQINGTLGGINQTGQQINGTAQQLNGTAQQALGLGQQYNTTANRGIDEWSRTNDIAQQGVDAARRLTDPVVMGEVAFSASLMAGIGGAAAGILVDGFSAAAGALWEAFTHAKRDARMLDEFKSAVDYYTKYKSQAGELEQLDRMMDFFEFAKGLHKSREQMLSLLSCSRENRKRRTRSTRSTRKRLISSRSGMPACARSRRPRPTCMSSATRSRPCRL